MRNSKIIKFINIGFNESKLKRAINKEIEFLESHENSAFTRRLRKQIDQEKSRILKNIGG